MSSSSSSGGGRRSRQQQKRQPAGWWPSWLPPYNSGGGDTPEPEAESGPKPPPGIDIAGYTLTPGYSPPPAPPISLPAPPPGVPVPGYRPPNEYGESTGEQSPDSDSGGQGRTGASQTEIGPPATTRPPAILVPPELLDISEDAFGSLEQQIAALSSGQPVESFTENIGQAPTPVTDVYGNRPLSPGQAQHVDHLLAVETDSLAREVLITLKRDGLPPKSEWNEFMAPYALWSWDAESDALALATLATIAESDWDETFAYADEDFVETVAQDQGDDRIEGLVIIDAKTGDTLLDVTGVVGADGSQYVGLQDTDVEALKGLELIFVHNHPNGSDASEEDLDSAFRAGAELLIVITPQGQEFVYIRGRYGMVKVRDEEASYEVGPENPEETEELRARSQAQAAAFQEDSPELIFRQDDPGIQIKVTGEVQFADSEAAVIMDEVGSYDKDTLEESLFNVVGKSRLNPFVVLVEDEKGKRFWIDLKQYGDTTYDIIAVENLAAIPYAAESGAIVDNPFENLVRQTVDFFPIALNEMTGVLQFGAPNCDNYGSLPECAHPGIDYFAPAGTDVRAVTSGEVIAVYVPAEDDYSDVYGDGLGSEVNEGNIYDPRDPEADTRKIFADGWLTEDSDRAYVIVRSGNAYFLYAHLDPNTIQAGTHVIQGQTIGTVGKDAEIEGNDHLHFEVKTHGGRHPDFDDTGEYVDPFDRPQIGINPLWLHSEGALDDLEYRYGEEMEPFEDQFQAMEMFRGNNGKIWRPEGFWITVVWPGEDVADDSTGR